MDRASAGLAGVSLALLSACVLFLASGPILTDDLWWHLAMGEVYAQEGPWPDGDPLLHTAHADAPVQHEWLFDVALHGVERLLGLPGLRVLHGLLAAAVLGAAFGLFRRATRSGVAAAFATCAFGVLAWWRLFQLRPDLVSILATFATWWLLLEAGRPPSWRRVAAFAGLLWVWANAHSLFALGLLLPAAAIAGTGARALLRRRIRSTERGPSPDGALARRLAAALAAGGAASLANPRGVAQHLTFFTSSRESGIWRVHDEWTPFDPFKYAFTSEAVSPLAWIVTDLLLGALLASAGLALVRFLRAPSEGRLRPLDPVGLAVAVAAAVAMLASVRFGWLGFFVLLHLARAGGLAVRAPGRKLRTALAGASVLLAVAFVLQPNLRHALRRVPQDPAAWLATPWLREKYHVAGVRFLRETGVEGNLFNKYPMGGFLGYWLAPRLRTFVDSRTEHYTRDVLDDYSTINVRGGREGEGFSEILDRREVDFFFGTGPPRGIWRDAVLFTAEHLNGVAGWIPVSRSPHHAIWLRDLPRNRENLSRIAAWYARAGVLFDPEVGLEPLQVARERPDWAIEHELLPRDWHALQAARAAGDLEAAGRIALVWCLLGEWETQLAIDREILAARPDDADARRRSVYALLRLQRRPEALIEARRLVASHPDDRLARRVAGIARAASRAPSARAAGVLVTLARFPLVDAEESDWLSEQLHGTRLRR